MNLQDWNRTSKEELIRQRDQLLSALRKIAYEPFGAADASHAEVLQAITEHARAAIAAAEAKPEQAVSA